MRLVMWHLLKLATTLLRCIPAFFRCRSEQALVEFALRQQLATYSQRGPKPRITPVDRCGFSISVRGGFTALFPTVIRSVNGEW